MAALDEFRHHEQLPPGPCRRAAAITPHDTNELGNVPRFIYVGGAGAVKVTTVYGDTVTFAAVPVGTVLPVAAKIVFSTGTTATNLIAIW